MRAIWNFIKFVLFLVIVLVVLGLIFRNSLIKFGIEKGSSFLGVPTTVEKVNVSIDSPVIEVDNLQVGNPVGMDFSDDANVVDLTKFRLHYEFLGLFKNKAHAYDVVVNVKSLCVELNSKGQLNVLNMEPDMVKAVRESQAKKQAGKEEEKEPAQIAVDRLLVQVGELKFKSSIPLIPDFDLGINYSNVFENLEGSNAEIAVKVLKGVAKGTPLEPVLNMGEIDVTKSLQQLGQQVTGAVGAAGEAATGAVNAAGDAAGKAGKAVGDAAGSAVDAASDAAGKAADKIKSLFGN